MMNRQQWQRWEDSYNDEQRAMDDVEGGRIVEPDFETFINWMVENSSVNFGVLLNEVKSAYKALPVDAPANTLEASFERFMSIVTDRPTDE